MTGTLTLTKNVTIDGTGQTVIVDGGCTFSGGQCQSGGVGVFTVNGAVTATLNRLTILHGNRVGDGGGIANSGALTVTNSTITGNNAVGDGGGINNSGSGTLTVTNSTLVGNHAVGFGGGIINNGMLTVTNSTLSGNATDKSGGGIYNGGTTAVTNGTLTLNTANFGGGGIANDLGGGPTTVTNTIVASNTGASRPDLYLAITSGGHNLIGTTSGATITLGPGDIVNPIPLLGTLGSHGGPTQTIPPLTGSPAIAHGDPAICAGTGGIAPVGVGD